MRWLHCNMVKQNCQSINISVLQLQHASPISPIFSLEINWEIIRNSQQISIEILDEMSMGRWELHGADSISIVNICESIIIGSVPGRHMKDIMGTYETQEVSRNYWESIWKQLLHWKWHARLSSMSLHAHDIISKNWVWREEQFIFTGCRVNRT